MDRHEEQFQGLITRNQPILKSDEDEVIDKKERNLVWMFGIGFFLVALIARLWFLFNVSTPDNPGAGWFGDAYHHWQIAYLSKEIGLGQGFLRLWDLKGMEFFWGLLHPLLTMIGFTITGSVSLAVERGMTAIFGSLSVGLVYLVVSKYWNKSAAFGASLLAALNPIGIFNDTSGMVEPLGIPFLLLAIYLWPKKPLQAGFYLCIALMARAEYWVFSLGIFAAMILISKKVGSNKKVMLAIGLFVPLLFYMKYLLNYTGNPIYPFYTNYVTNIYGTWQLKTVFTASDILARYIFQAIFAVSVISAVFVLWKKPKGSFVHLLGIGNWMFLGASLGIGAYIASYASYVWYVRFMILPYIYIGILISVFLFYYLPKIKFIKIIDKIKFNYLILIAILAVSQIVWIPIMKKYNSTQPAWQKTILISEEIMRHYNGGKMVFLEVNPEYTYTMVTKFGFDGKNFVSEMFDPYFYFKNDPYTNWSADRLVVFKWLKDNNVKVIVTYGGTERYAKLSELEPEYIGQGEQLTTANIVVYKVDDKKIQRDF
jgi:hypothetical protein